MRLPVLGSDPGKHWGDPEFRPGVRRLTVADMAEFLVELYVSGAAADGADRETRRARSAAAELTAEGRPVRVLRSIFVPEDETCFLLVEADTAEAVQEAATRAAVPFERVLATVADRTTDETKENHT